MDNFMDKLAQKVNAQEMIKANSQAEAAEMKRLQMQVAEYEKILQEMRKLNYKNAELSDKMEAMIGDNAGKIEGMKEDEHRLVTALRDLTDEQTRNREAELGKKESETLERELAETEKYKNQIRDIAELLEKKFANSDDFVHKENVKVYRNVQAVVVDETKRQAEEAQTQYQKLDKKVNRVMIFSILSMAASIISILLMIINMLNIKLF
ncbi:MAG: hypothetical protein HFJ08_02130 [Lachnospiraceae bacterium]|jgi:hypothetical protein|nr:hypothetical protein [Lachnospiraceae bacterium]MCI9400660.1 hypothetical protein [Lachnospiraceae bacterium]